MTVGFGLQIVQGAVRKLQFTFLGRVSFQKKCVRVRHLAYLFPAPILEHLFLFEEATDTCRALHKVAFQALQVHLKA